MKKYIFSSTILFLLASVSSQAADAQLNIAVTHEGPHLVLSVNSIKEAPDFYAIMKTLLTDRIGTHEYRRDNYAPSFHNSAGAITLHVENGVPVLKTGAPNTSAVYRDFFNAPQIVATGLSPADWIRLVKEAVRNHAPQSGQ